jgi:hypothetical protein
MSKISKDSFNKLCSDLVYGLGCAGPNKMTIDQYYDFLSKYSESRLIEIFTFLKINHPVKSFPIINDFNNAAKETYVENTYRHEKRDENVQPYGQETEQLTAKFKIMDEIRDIVCKPLIGNYDSKNPPLGKTWPLMRKFYRGAVEAGQVYSLQTRQWIDKKAAQNFPFFDPAEMGFPV